MIKRLAKETIYTFMGIDEARWQEASIFEKIGHTIATILFLTYTVVLPALLFIVLWLEG